MHRKNRPGHHSTPPQTPVTASTTAPKPFISNEREGKETLAPTISLVPAPYLQRPSRSIQANTLSLHRYAKQCLFTPNQSAFQAHSLALLIFLVASISYLQPSSQLFRKRLLAAPKSRHTFAIPKRQTHQRKRRKHLLRHKLKGRELQWNASCLAYRSQPQVSKFISRITCTGEKSHRIFAARFNRKQPDFRVFLLENLKIKKILYLCTPKTNRIHQ